MAVNFPAQPQPVGTIHTDPDSGLSWEWNGTKWVPVTGDTLWQVDGTNIFYDQGNVGVGANTPTRNLVVSGGANEGVLKVTNATSGTDLAQGLDIIHFVNGETDIHNRPNSALRLSTNNAEAARFDASGLFAVGNNQPGNFSPDFNRAVIGTGNGVQGMTLFAGNTATSGIAFADGIGVNDRTVGQVTYRHNENALTFVANNAERLRLGSAGQVGIAGANFGDAGQVLTSQGNAAAPQWATPAGGWTSVGSEALANQGTVVFNTPDTATSIRISVNGLQIGSGPSQAIALRFNNIATNTYRYSVSTTGGQDSEFGTDRFNVIHPGQASSTNANWFGYLEMWRLAGGSWQIQGSNIMDLSGNNNATQHFQGWWINNAAITRVDLFSNGPGNYAGGSAEVYWM